MRWSDLSETMIMFGEKIFQYINIFCEKLSKANTK